MEATPMMTTGQQPTDHGERMDRFTARRLAAAVAGLAGYRVMRTYTAPADAGAWVIDVLDVVSDQRMTITGPQHWIDARAAGVEWRRAIKAREEREKLDLAVGNSEDEGNDRTDLREAAGMTTTTEAAAPAVVETAKILNGTTQKPFAFNWKQWVTITKTSLEKAQQDIAQLRASRATLEEELRQELRRRTAELNAQIAELQSVAKKLQRALDDVQRPERVTRPQRAAGERTPIVVVNGQPTLRQRLYDWADAHGGEVVTTEAAKALAVNLVQIHGQFGGNNGLLKKGKFERSAPGVYRRVQQAASA